MGHRRCSTIDTNRGLQRHIIWFWYNRWGSLIWSIYRGGNTSLRNRKNTWKMAWAKWSEVVWKGLKTFLIQSALYFKIDKIKSWGKPGEVRFFSVSLVSKLSIDQSAFRIRPRSLRSWTSDFRKFHFRP